MDARRTELLTDLSLLCPSHILPLSLLPLFSFPFISLQCYITASLLWFPQSPPSHTTILGCTFDPSVDTLGTDSQSVLEIFPKYLPVCPLPFCSCYSSAPVTPPSQVHSYTLAYIVFFFLHYAILVFHYDFLPPPLFLPPLFVLTALIS